MELKTVVLGDKAVQVAVSDLAAIEAYKTSMGQQLADANKAKKESDEEKDKEIGRLTAELKTAKDAAIIDVDKLVAERSALVAQVKALDSAIDPTGKTDADLRRAAAASKLGDAAVQGVSDAVVEGMFLAISKAPGGSRCRRTSPWRQIHWRSGYRHAGRLEQGKRRPKRMALRSRR